MQNNVLSLHRVKLHSIVPAPNNKLAVTLTDGKEFVCCESIAQWSEEVASPGVLEALFNHWKQRATVRYTGRIVINPDTPARVAEAFHLYNHTGATSVK